MKYLSILLVLVIVVASGSVYAQSGSRLNGTSYTFVMKDVALGDEEIIDKISFNNNTISSEYYGSRGFSNGSVSERLVGDISHFEFTMQAGANETLKYSGTVQEGYIDGTILVTDAQGNERTMAFRGMTTAMWNNMPNEKTETVK